MDSCMGQGGTEGQHFHRRYDLAGGCKVTSLNLQNWDGPSVQRTLMMLTKLKRMKTIGLYCTNVKSGIDNLPVSSKC
eukprot:scaffold277504_cov14-Tisochrysis_lutea.AAC.1